MLLEPIDLSTEQDFHLGNVRRHVAELHGFGTVCGLRVDETDCYEQVVLRPGVAVDCLGRELRVECDMKIDLHEAIERAVEARKKKERREVEPIPADEDEGYGDKDKDRDEDDECEPVDVYLSLCYRDFPERPVQAIGGPETCCASVCQMSRTRSGVCVEVTLEPPKVPHKIREIIEELLEAKHEKLREWLCEWITDPCWQCKPDPCGREHHCVGLARVRVVPGGKVVEIDNCAVRPLVLPTVLIAELTRYAVEQVRRPR
jgi:hypothetical protein